MRSRTLLARLAPVLIVPSHALCQVGHASAHQLIACADNPTPGVRPPSSACALLVRRQFDVLPKGPLVLRLETFSDTATAQRAGTPASAVVRAGGKVWLLTLASAGEHSPGGRLVKELGPLPAVPPARRYEIQVSEADFGPDVNPALSNAVHTHSGPEIWYLLTGEQCLETPGGITRARAGEGMFVHAETPMQLRIVGPSKRDALFIIIHDAARPATTVSAWQPKGSCAK